MHARYQAIGAVTLLLLTLGTGATGEDYPQDLITEQTVSEPIVEESTAAQVRAEEVVLSPNLVHIGCPVGFEALYTTTPFAMNHPDGSQTNYWPTCEWFHDGREFPGCPSYGLEVVYPPICMQHRNQNEE